MKGNVDGVAFLLRKNKVDHFHGTGAHRRPGQGRGHLHQRGEAGRSRPRPIVIATGSDVAQLPGIEIDEKTVVSSTGALSLAKVPKRLLVVGAGVIGLELGSVWRRLGAEVTGRRVPRPHPARARRRGRPPDAEDPGQAGHELQARPQGDRASRRRAAAHKVSIEPAAGGEAETLETDVVLVAIGRVPLHGRPRARGSGRGARQPRARDRRSSTSRPTLPASTPSAT